jgi:uncharacterized protein with NAD-binding domain and iron-sulfur cluster
VLPNWVMYIILRFKWVQQSFVPNLKTMEFINSISSSHHDRIKLRRKFISIHLNHLRWFEHITHGNYSHWYWSMELLKMLIPQYISSFGLPIAIYQNFILTLNPGFCEYVLN